MTSRTTRTGATGDAGVRESEPPAPARPLPIAGEVTVRVRYAECDPQGVAHHSSYVAWLELARTELLRGEKRVDPATGFASYAGGLDYATMERAGVFLVITKLSMSYKAPARYDEHVVIRAEVTGGGRARLDHEYAAYRARPDGSKGDLLLTGTSTLACVDSNGRPRPLPDWLRADRMLAASRDAAE